MILRALATRVSAFSYSSAVITVTHTPAILQVLTNQIIRCLGLYRAIQKLWPVFVVGSLETGQRGVQRPTNILFR